MMMIMIMMVVVVVVVVVVMIIIIIISFSGSVNEDGILDISNIQPNMSGVYVCDAENAAGIVQKLFYVIVHSK
jgi:hypothetical protein